MAQDTSTTKNRPADVAGTVAGRKAAVERAQRHILKTCILGTTVIAVSVTLFLLASELILWFLPVRTGLHWQPVNAANPIVHFEPNRDFIYSDEWNFAIVNHGRVNNAGFINDQDYKRDDPRPLLVVIGDSYIEAQMVPYELTVHGRLQTHLGDRARVYSFGVSGAPLSQYLVFAEHAREKYQPQLMVFNIIGNDFDQSLKKYQSNSTMHTYVSDDSGALTLWRGEYAPSRTRVLLRQSSLVRYLLLNVEITRIYQAIQNVWLAQDGNYVGNTLADISAERLADSTAALNAFFRDLPKYSGLSAERILFLVDGGRDMIYAVESSDIMKRSFVSIMRNRFITIARESGYEVIDLHPRFDMHFKEHGSRFEFPTDGHWNGLGHAIAAEAVQASDVFRRFEGVSVDTVSSTTSSPGSRWSRTKREQEQ